MNKCLFIQYPKCTTCQNAKKWLDDHGIVYTDRHIVENPPSVEELSQWIPQSGLPIKKFFNTSGLVYKGMELKDKLPLMSDADKIKLLASNGMLVKRPILVFNGKILTGFNAAAWADQLTDGK